MPVSKRKAFAYITHRDQQGDRLLVFSHPDAPEAGIQVPAGTLLAGERTEDGVLREAHEETGFVDLEVHCFLGERDYHLAHAEPGEIHQRAFFHLRASGDPPSTWRHQETDPDDGADEWPLFEFFWARLPDGVPDLIADHGALLPALIECLAARVARRSVAGTAPAWGTLLAASPWRSSMSASRSQPDTGPDDAALRARFDAELLAAGLVLSDDDRVRLFPTWADHLPTRDSLRAAAPALPEEPSLIEKPSQPGGGVSAVSPSGGAR